MLAENHDLSEYAGFVQDPGEGRLTIEAVMEQAIPAEVLTCILCTRFRSRQEHTLAERFFGNAPKIWRASRTENRKRRQKD